MIMSIDRFGLDSFFFFFLFRINSPHAPSHSESNIILHEQIAALDLKAASSEIGSLPGWM